MPQAPHLTIEVAITLNMAWRLARPEPVLLAIEVAQAPGQRVIRADLDLGPSATAHRTPGGPGLPGGRLWALCGSDRLDLRYEARVALDRPAIALDDLPASAPHLLPPEVLPHLWPSRYVDSDRLAEIPKALFGVQEAGPKAGGARVAAIRDWVGRALDYVPGGSTGATMASDTLASRQGVCRDYAHLVCALARASGIPARYVAGYGLGVTPPDFHAMAEVWLAGGWHLVDATGMTGPESFARITTGRDAADTAFMETAHDAHPLAQSVTVARAAPPA